MDPTLKAREEEGGIVKGRIRQLYHFLREANQLRFRPVRTLAEQPRFIRLSDMPDHPAMQIHRPVKVENSQEIPDVLLRVRRPAISRCPEPPSSLIGWLLPNWGDPLKTPEYAQSQNAVQQDDEGNEQTVTIQFEDEEERVNDFLEWTVKRDAWVIPELAARKAMHFFELFYDIYSTIEKDGEQLELLLADGHLAWQTQSGVDGPISINHPVLLKRVELRFDANIPEFTIHETEREAELYGNLFVDLSDIEPTSLRNRKAELENAGYHPLGWDDTEAFLKALVLTISPVDGEFLDQPGHEATSFPRMWRDTVLLLRKRVAGIANAVDSILDDIDQKVVFPSSLAQITGTVDEWKGYGLTEEGSNGNPVGQESVASPVTLSDDDILLVSEANDEQLQIIRKLDRSGAVIVQGPPGTGKTHTISNLIGHLLAHGKSILVTAHTAKALRVLRDKVPVMLQPLCVSVLGSDQNARRQLESSIGSITERLTSDTSETLLQKAAQFEAERKSLLRKTNELRHSLREALENEYLEVVGGKQKFAPSDAARFVASNQLEHNWIPSPVKLNADVNISDQEIIRLYALGVSFSASEELDAQLPLPEMASLPSERQFQMMVTDYQHLLSSDLTYGADKWQMGSGNSQALEEIANTLSSEFSEDLRRQAWRPYAIVAGLHGGSEREVWERLITNIEKAAEANSRHALVLHHRPRLSETIPVHKQRQITLEICDHIGAGGKLGFLQLATRAEWRQLIKTVSVAAGRPSHPDHFEALNHLAELEAVRLELEDLWNNFIGQHGNQTFDKLGSAPELACRALIPEIRRCLEWHAKVWVPIGKKLWEEGLKLDDLIASQPREASQVAEYLLLERLAGGILPQLIGSEGARRRLKECEAGFDRLANLSTQIDPTSPDRGCVGMLIKAVRSRDANGYASALEYARRLHAVKPLVEERNRLISTLNLVAPGWVEHLTNRIPPHNEGKIPGNVETAWTWRQLNDTLLERDKLDAQAIQKEIEKTRIILREVTQWLIDARAWGKQLQRLQGNNSIRQALVGWLDTTKRLISTKQMDKRQTLLTEARKLMKRCSEAVPVWIMPISIMAESFDPRTTQFDVVIIDEASQADINALIPLYMGKQIVVVGDHEQVTPLGVGRDQTILENLRKSILRDIPNSHLFDNMSSIYDIGRQSFGDAIRLVEHFRCVPEIIAFSNQLSYEGKIRPLRESGSSNIKPACVACRVNGIREGDLNYAEAERIIATIKAMIKHPAYKGKSIGIISMVGDSQAVLIQSMLHKEIDGVELEKRRIQAGISGEFQGDERDVMFLTMVDSAVEEGTLRATGEGAFESTKKRYNVAASRARDQLWVVHSFNPDLHLKSSDLRFKLLQHIKDPLASIRAHNQEIIKTESPFEREVLKRLIDAGFKVKTQWQVGYYRIDMVVEGDGKRLAVECDGDRYHPMENLASDMNRQAILERLGWTFVRIRGSAFYRNPDMAMQTIFASLREQEISPIAARDEDPNTDLTLIHEIDEIIRNGFDSEEEDHAGINIKQDTQGDLPHPIAATAKIFDIPTKRARIDQVADSLEAFNRPFVDARKTTPLEDQRRSDGGGVVRSVRDRPIESAFRSRKSNLIFSDYVEYAGPPGVDPRNTSMQRVTEGVSKIIEAEGPMIAKRAYDIYLRSCGIKRMGHELKNTMNQALSDAIRSKRIVAEKESADSDLQYSVVRLIDSPAIKLRVRGSRSFEEIPPSELQLAARYLMDQHGISSVTDEHLHALLECFDLKRLTTTVRTALIDIINMDFPYADEFLNQIRVPTNIHEKS